MKIVSILFILLLFSCSAPVEEKEQTIELSYIAWACDCANWATLEDIHKFSDNIDDTLAKLSVFIEPATPGIKLPDTLGYNGDIIKFTGHFHKEKGVPAGYHSFEPVEKASVFRYTSYTVIKSNHHEAIEALKKP